MKIERIISFGVEFKNEFDEEIKSISIYYFFEDKWNALEIGDEVESSTIVILDRAKRESIAYHVAGSKTVWFFVEKLNCVVAVDFPTSPRRNVKDKFRSKIEKILNRAENTFKVAHNSLTLLLARDEFEVRLQNAIKINPVLEIEEGAQENQVPSILAVLALDIDHFKQINDTYGHLYGNEVLKTFARRLEDCAKNIIFEEENRISIVVGHPSGEEFLIFIAGPATKEEIYNWANIFRAKIADEALPSDVEWEKLATECDISKITVPPKYERNVRTSIGVALYTPSSEIVSSKFLLEKADTALYRAKDAGRNQVVMFDDILNSWGRVLEHNQNNSVIAIDIGTNVGVQQGQEFIIYSPFFTGKKKFMTNDGRTTRSLGFYPRVELSRITAFNVQSEISFCFFSNEDDMTIQVENGSILEAIPIGSIGHITPYTAKYLNNGVDKLFAGNVKELMNFLLVDSNSSIIPFSIVFKFLKYDEYVKRYGSAALNTAITWLYRTIHARFPALKYIGLFDVSSLGIAGSNDFYHEETVKSIALDFSSEFPELGLLVGIFCNLDFTSQVEKTEEKIQAKYSIDFAQFAASRYAIGIDGNINHFNYSLAVRILKAQYNSKEYKSAILDFEKFIEIGIVSGSILNLGGLLYAAINEYSIAAEKFSLALKRSPEIIVYKSNYADMLQRLGKDEASLEIFNSFSEIEISKLLKIHRFGIYKYAILLAKAKQKKSNLFIKKRYAKIREEVLGFENYSEKYPKGIAFIKSIPIE